MINSVPAELVPHHMGKLLPFLENFAARSHERWSVDWLEAEILTGRMHVWCISDWQAVVLLTVGDNHINIEAGAGVRREDWQDEVHAEVVAWAKALGKKRIFSKARPGWSKYAKQRGFKEIHRELMLEL